MVSNRFVLFVYDFPHKKSCDFLLRLILNDYKPDLVVGAPWKRLDIEKSKIRTSHSFSDNIHPKLICKKLNIPYISVDHNSKKLENMLLKGQYQLGVVGGSRIIKKNIINSFELGILNLHPGLLPENRGLDNIQYAVYKDIPMGITNHLIDENVDAGSIIDKYIIPTYGDDTLIDIDLRIKEAQNNTLTYTISKIFSSDYELKNQQNVDTNKFSKNIPGSDIVDKFVQENWDFYKKKWCYDINGWKCSCGFQIIDSYCQYCKKEYKELNNILKEI